MLRLLSVIFIGAIAVNAQRFKDAEVIPETNLEHESTEADSDLGDAGRTFSEICSENGFKFEEHKVTTDDGYMLTVYRIPGTVDDRTSGKPPVLFQHGVFDSAYGWIMHYPDVAPAFVELVLRVACDVAGRFLGFLAPSGARRQASVPL